MVFGGKSKNKASKSKPESDNAGVPSIPVEYKVTAYPKNEAAGVLIAIRQLPGYAMATNIIGQALSSRVDRVLMDFTATGAVVRFRVDGIWEAMPPMDRATADAALEMIKKVAGMNPKERRSKQVGKFAAQVNGTDWLLECMSQGVQSGERVLLTIDPKKIVLKTLADLGMREKMQESLKAFMNGDEGIAVISGPPGQGLPTTWRVALESADKFIRDFISLEDKADPDPEIINVTKNLVDIAGGEKPEAILDRLLLKQPDCVVLTKPFNEAVMKLIMKELQVNKKHSIMRLQANDAAEALVAMVQTYKGLAKDVIKHTHCVLNQRLIRRLCDKCRQPYAPTPQLLQKLGIPAGRVRQLYNPFVPPPPEQRVDAKGNPIEIEICKQCNGRGYFGRMAIFELLELNDAIRKVVLTNPKPEAIRAVAAEQGHRSFQEEGIVAVALGLTSLQEIQKMIQGK